jgi:hypothetical protein
VCPEGLDIVPETYVIFNQLTRLIARENFINFSRRKSFRSYIRSMRFDVLTAVKMPMVVSWVVTSTQPNKSSGSGLFCHFSSISRDKSYFF